VALSTTPDSTSSNAWPARPCEARPLHSLRLTLLRALHCTPSGVRVRACLRPPNLPLGDGSVYVIEIGSNPEIGPTLGDFWEQNGNRAGDITAMRLQDA